MLTVESVDQYYGGSHILRHVSLDVAPGKVTAVLGRNGVGKTTLLKAIMGLVPVTRGTIRFAGEDLTRAPSHRRARAGIGYVPQGREIFPRLTVEENLLIGLRARSARAPLPPRVLRLFPALAAMLRRRGGDLSGGQQQQLAIARALATEPSLLILDEPTEGIQPSIIQQIEQVIRELVAEGRTAVLLNKEIDGFIVNRILHAASQEAYRLLDAGVASFEDIDVAVEKGLNWPLGPFRLGDFSGLDVTYNARLHMYRTTGDERYKPSPQLEAKVKAGKLGRKTGEGWYRYEK